MSQQELYEILKDGKWHSVIELMKQLNISRVSIRKNIKGIDALNSVVIESESILHYRMVGKRNAIYKESERARI